PARWRCSTLLATARARTSSWPSHTSAIPPRAIRWTSRYRPANTWPPTSAGWSGTGVVLPKSAGGVEGDSDRARSGVGTDDGPDVADEDLVSRAHLAEHVQELFGVVGFGVDHGEVLDGAVLLHLVDQIAERSRPG